MGNFVWPEWKPLPQDTPPPSAPPPDPMVAREEKIANDTRVEQALNRFLSAKQGALFEAPDAFYRTQGEDAIHAAPVVSKNLDQLRSDLLDGLGNDYQRQRLGTALDAQMQLTRDGMARHVAEQSLAWQRGIAQDRIALLTKEAAQHHNDTDLVDALGHAAASAARAHSRVGDGPPGGEAEDAAAAQARSGVLGAAIQARLDRGDTTGANALLTQVQGQLDPQHAGPLQGQIDTGQRLAAAKDYADGIASASPAASLEEIDAQHQAAVQQAAADHPDDPRQQTLAQHFLNQAFDARRQELQQGNDGPANAVETWLNTPGADGGPQRDLPPPAVLSRLDDDAVRDLVFRLGRDDRGLKVVPLPDKPSMDGAFVSQNLANDAKGASTPATQGADQSDPEYAEPPQPQILISPSSRGLVSVNHTPDDATGIPQSNSELAQAPAAGSTKKPPSPAKSDDPQASSKPGKAGNSSSEPADLSKLSEITSASEAYDHWLGGSGEPRQIPFERIDTRSVQPEQFKVVQEKLLEGKPGTYDIKGTTGFHADQSSLTKWSIGHITLGIEGKLVINDNGTYEFKGKLRALRDRYDMDAAEHRSTLGEFATTIGRQGGRVFGHKDYFVYFPGEKAISSPP